MTKREDACIHEGNCFPCELLIYLSIEILTILTLFSLIYFFFTVHCIY